MSALRGIAVADMPNLFFLLGPNTALGHNSVVFMIESQIRYVAQAIEAADRAGAQGWPRPGPPPTATTSACSTIWPARCSTPAAAVAGTWTPTASTAPSGAA